MRHSSEMEVGLLSNVVTDCTHILLAQYEVCRDVIGLLARTGCVQIKYRNLKITRLIFLKRNYTEMMTFINKLLLNVCNCAYVD